MAKTKLLVDTDVFIDYFNLGFYSAILYNPDFVIHYSIITKKELLSKQGLSDRERKVILETLSEFRLILLDRPITLAFSYLGGKYPGIEKEDLLIAATAFAKKIPLLTRNWKHYRQIEEIILFTGER